MSKEAEFIDTDEITTSEPVILIEGDRDFIEDYVKRQYQIESEMAVLTSQFQRRLRALQQQKKVLEYHHADRANNIFRKILAEKKKGKFVDFDYGRMTTRKAGDFYRVRDSKIRDISEVIKDAGAEFTETDLMVSGLVKREISWSPSTFKKLLKEDGNGNFTLSNGLKDILLSDEFVQKYIEYVEPTENISIDFSSE